MEGRVGAAVADTTLRGTFQVQRGRFRTQSCQFRARNAKFQGQGRGQNASSIINQKINQSINQLINCERFAQTTGPGPEKAEFLKLFVAFLGVFGLIFNEVFHHWKHLESAGGALLVLRSGMDLSKILKNLLDGSWGFFGTRLCQHFQMFGFPEFRYFQNILRGYALSRRSLLAPWECHLGGSVPPF